MVACSIIHSLTHSLTRFLGMHEYKEMKAFLYHLKQNPHQVSAPPTSTTVDNNKELSEIGIYTLSYSHTHTLTCILTNSFTLSERKKKLMLSKLL